MMIAPGYRKLIVVRLAVLLLGLLALHTTPTFGQNGPERFWLAGRYDGNRVVVYFDAVKFEGTMSSNQHRKPLQTS
jgi:hypothetical protein